jgi:hypothetical protein
VANVQSAASVTDTDARNHTGEEETMPTSLEEMLSRSTCALCGRGVYIDTHGEGRVHCEGCKLAIDNCTCSSEKS